VPTQVRLAPAPTVRARTPPADEPEALDLLVRLLGTDVIPIGQLAAIVLRYPMAQSPECPWTVGPVDIHLDVPGAALVQAGAVAADVDVLPRRPARTHRGDCGAPGRAPAALRSGHSRRSAAAYGVVLRILRARAGRLAPDICTTSRPDPVWHVPDTAAADKVRVKYRMGSSF